jgi:hypothetical protein
MPDRQFRAAIAFVRGRESRRLAYAELRREARNPRTFNEKVRYKAAFDRRPIITTFADKIAVREHVARTIGPAFLTEAYAVACDPSLIGWNSLPREYVCKVNHGSGGVIVVWDGADSSVQLPEDPRVGWTRLKVRPEHADPARIRALCDYWLALDYSYWGPGHRRMPEWAYQGIKRGVIVEELLRDEDGRLPIDHKLFVVNGRTRMIRLDSPSASGRKSMAHFDRDWAALPVQFVEGGEPYPVTDPLPSRPENLDSLLRVAERLAAGTDFVRVDLYSLGARVVFGELTNYPTAGAGRFIPDCFDEELGASWVIDYGPDRGHGSSEVPRRCFHGDGT